MPTTKQRTTQQWILWLGSRRRRQRVEATVELCRLYEPLVKASAQRYRQASTEARHEELEQMARLALCEACVSFDASRWTRGADGLERLFARHAVWTVRHVLAEYVRSQPNPVRLPGVIMDRLPQVRRAAVRLAQQLMREPTVDELAAVIGMPRGKYQRNAAAMIAKMLAYDAGPVELDLNSDVGVPTPEAAMLYSEAQRGLLRQRQLR